MKKYIEIYNDAFEEGVICAYRDFINNKRKEFDFPDKEFMSKLYDLAYIYSYNRIYNILLLFDKKI